MSSTPTADGGAPTGPRAADGRVRQFLLTGGRARPESALPLETPMTALPGVAAVDLMPEHREILRRCAEPQTVVDLSAALGVPVGVVRVLALDLAERGALEVHRTALATVPPHRDLQLLEEALDGIANL